MVCRPGDTNCSLVIPFSDVATAAVCATSALRDILAHLGEIDDYSQKVSAPLFGRNEFHRVADLICGDETDADSADYGTAARRSVGAVPLVRLTYSREMMLEFFATDA